MRRRRRLVLLLLLLLPLLLLLLPTHTVTEPDFCIGIVPVKCVEANSAHQGVQRHDPQPQPQA